MVETNELLAIAKRAEIVKRLQHIGSTLGPLPGAAPTILPAVISALKQSQDDVPSLIADIQDRIITIVTLEKVVIDQELEIAALKERLQILEGSASDED